MIDLKEFENFMIEEELSENTRKIYLFAVEQYFSKYDEVNKTNILLWKAEMQEKYKPQTCNLRLSGIKNTASLKTLQLK